MLATRYSLLATFPHVPTRPPRRRLAADQLRTITFEPDIAPHATGSVLVSFGKTRVICAATIEPGVPTWMKQQGVKGGNQGLAVGGGHRVGPVKPACGRIANHR